MILLMPYSPGKQNKSFSKTINKIIKKVALAVFRNNKILLVRTGKQEHVFYTLGGKIKEGESEIDCLKREVWEEIGCSIDHHSLKFLDEFEDMAHGGGILNVKLYEGKLIGKPKPSSEIVEIGWFDTKSDPKNLSIIAQRTIFPWLKEHGYIN